MMLFFPFTADGEWGVMMMSSFYFWSLLFFARMFFLLCV